uniref:RNA polymerase II-associated protein 3 n=1 Tax=Sinocyclocheilus grahami TaxID=75366 RepID=A0A672SMN6_SINGR
VMSGNKAVELQTQMRQNAEDLQNFMKELNNWEEEIKKKDQQLRAGNISEPPTLPPVRNNDYKKTKTSVKRQTNGLKEQKETQRIKSYDYQAWDKFDVDKSLEAMDAEESPVHSNESDSEGLQVDRDLALTEKQKGNECFRDGRYDSAIECYTRGMDSDPYSPVLPTNRAACFFRLNKFAVAESDCNLAIALDGKYVKAYIRRAEARTALNKHQDALEGLTLYQEIMEVNEVTLVIEYLSSSEKSESDAEPLQQLQEQEQQRKQEAVVQKDRGNAYFKEGKYEAAVECYSRGMEADGTNALLPANRAMAYLKLHRFSDAEQDCSTALALDASYAKAFARRATARAARGRTREAKEGPPSIASVAFTASPSFLRSSHAFVFVCRLRAGSEAGAGKQTESITFRKNDNQLILRCQYFLPSTTILFLCFSSQRLTLQQISPDAYLKIFQNSLEPDVLNHILKTFHSFFQREDASLLLAVLRSLASVRRFDMTVMFMSSAEKKLLQELFDWIHSAGLGDASVPGLQKKYGL